MPACNTEPRIQSAITWMAVVSLLGVTLLAAPPARADIGSVSASTDEVVQGGIVTVSLSLSSEGGCVTGDSPHSTIVILVLPSCLSNNHTATVATTVLTPPGDYEIVFEQRPLLGGRLLGSATVELTVTSLLPPPTTTTSTTSTTSTTTTTTTTSTTTTNPPPSTTTTRQQPIVESPTTTTWTVAPATTTSTTLDELAGSAPERPESPTTSTSSATTTPGSTTTSSTIDDDIGGAVDPDDPPDDSGLPPAPEEVIAAPAPVNDPIRGFLDPFLPAVVSDVISSPFHVIGSIISGVLDTGRNVALSLLVLVVYAAYLLSRWRTLQSGDLGMRP